jgi:hypothetical protein
MSFEEHDINWNQLENDDPLEGVAIAVPGDEHSFEEMALCFAAEFIGMGWKEQEIIKLFRNPFYRGPNLVYQKKGLDFIRKIIQRAIEAHQRRLERFGNATKMKRR